MSERDIADQVADQVLAALASGKQIAPFTARGGLSLADAYRIPPLIRAAFEARGERILGRKIGFTNRNIWDQYGVHAPIWGYMTDRTVSDLSPSSSFRRASEPGVQGPGSKALDSGPSASRRPGMTDLRCGDFTEPRIEPEIIFGLRAPPAPDMDESALLDCIAWLAAGFEIVQSIFPNWKFTPPDTVAANGLHGALLIGERHAVAPRKAQWLHELSTFTVDLTCNGKAIDHGVAANVLGGPLLALKHLAGMLAQDRHNAPLAAGDIISTGTLTKAFPVAPGESWTATFAGIPLAPVTPAFA
ncbi:MAG: fumarylacetoacetate hydrolase family protein [Pseudolabrys sp.]|nr:fumarylacetoacetate hydrolase family protein [Pseudolabrys sp.]